MLGPAVPPPAQRASGSLEDQLQDRAFCRGILQPGVALDLVVKVRIEIPLRYS